MPSERYDSDYIRATDGQMINECGQSLLLRIQIPVICSVHCPREEGIIVLLYNDYFRVSLLYDQMMICQLIPPSLMKNQPRTENDM